MGGLRAFLAGLRPLRRAYYHLAGARSYRRLRLDRAALADATSRNRRTLGLVPRWVDEETLSASVFGYGMPDRIRAAIDAPLTASVTYSDLLVVLARAHGPGLRYLELGPSVGKNLLQVSRAVTGAYLCAVDIENINPVLAAFFEPLETTTWQLPSSTMRPSPAVDALFADRETGNRLRYIAADLFDRTTWDRLAGMQFDLVFSDAFHSPEALLGEWHNLRDRDLLARTGFTMVWDDLTSRPMRAAFDRIAGEMAEVYGRESTTLSLELFDGWIGKGEPPHPIGIVRYAPNAKA